MNTIVGLFGLRVVSANWGPRGAMTALRRAKAQGFRPALIFDIGASNGYWTRACLNIFSDSRYLLADPLTGNRDALSALARRDNRIKIWYGAVGAANGQVAIHCHGDQSSALSSSEFRGPEISAEVTTVDELFAREQSPSPVLLKADVQGYELQILYGASNCLTRTEMLLLEVSYRQLYERGALAHEVIGYLGERGFRIYDICSYIQRPADRELAQSDVLFVHETSRLLQHQGWN